MAKYDWGDGHGRVHSRPKKTIQPKPPRTTGGIHGPGPQNLGRGNWLQGVETGPDGKPSATAAYKALPKPPAPQPPDPAFEAWKAQQGLQQGLDNAEATYQQGQIGQTTGYNAAGAVDYSNPYSQAALLQENYKRSKAGTQNSYASQGQLYSGAYGRMQGENDRNYSIGSDQLQRSAANQYHGIAQGQAQAGLQYGTGLTEQQRQALFRALGVA